MKRVRISSDGVSTQVRVGSQLMHDVQEVLIRLRPSGPAVVTLTILAEHVEVDGQAVLNFGGGGTEETVNLRAGKSKRPGTI